MKRILLVDDAATVRMYHRNILEAAHYLVEEAVNGIEGLEKALHQPYDLYIVDINMPKLDGYGFLRQLRGEPLVHAPAIMISTESQANDRVLAYRAGANDYLVKPVTPAQLLMHVRLLVGEGGQ
ncbi:response regulator [Herbaspirillum seropedicae]|uniref:Chemotaxis CheY protein n=1 Tax=Herbaspirillum seropedicae (strain SmR1) TaxID=757424 RepID=D8IQV5_HERSS|nr:response regulator [Herbaspirillum seropedicae]ADJ63216.1 chemotaxis CheY protein [Herbaspirillum seropedicae SmR1]AKN65264.1 chemotaxis protein CheY [Herbaspirillum seropedicae]AON54027.1 chemotaxis CheY protein [Herbaspirillum seropedicae]MDR6394989.1 two-component system chemotaxis response regulator CheY [Herbaspirillum seropedicae]NQE31503.1 chemotaxis protein CheY [Herbaspirillum seropedicae]